jgi:hypothetical protein
MSCEWLRWGVDDCVDDCYDCVSCVVVLTRVNALTWWRVVCWCVIAVLMCWWLWCVDVLVCWCAVVLMCWCVDDYVVCCCVDDNNCVDVLMRWCVTHPPDQKHRFFSAILHQFFSHTLLHSTLLPQPARRRQHGHPFRCGNDMEWCWIVLESCVDVSMSWCVDDCVDVSMIVLMCWCVDDCVDV